MPAQAPKPDPLDTVERFESYGGALRELVREHLDELRSGAIDAPEIYESIRQLRGAIDDLEQALKEIESNAHQLKVCESSTGSVIGVTDLSTGSPSCD